MAPPSTPSPHRFLPGARRQNSPNSSAKPSSRLKQSTTIHQDRTPPAGTSDSPQQTLRPPLHPTASQFAPTPRFSLAKSKVPTQRPNAPTSPPRSSLAHALRPPRVGEDVEDAASSDVEHDEHREDDTEMLLTTEQDEVIVQPSIELQDQDLDKSHNENAPTSLPFSPKRRRLESDFTLPPKPATSNSTHPRFAPYSSNLHSPATTTYTPAPPTLRPAFLRPPTPPLANPLPQAFSPHRRGAAFVPGGTASTVQGWVIAAGQSAAAARKQQNSYPQYLQTQTQSEGEGWGFRVRVEKAEEMGSEGWRVLGRRDDSGQRVGCLLVGQGKGEVRVGGWVGVRGLGWEVEVDGEGRWWVGVEWEGG